MVKLCLATSLMGNCNVGFNGMMTMLVGVVYALTTVVLGPFLDEATTMIRGRGDRDHTRVTF